MEPISNALGTVDYAIQIALTIQRTVEAYRHNPIEYKTLLSRFQSIRFTLNYLKNDEGIDLSSPLWGSSFFRISNHFKAAAEELEDIRHDLQSNPIRRFVTANDISKRIKVLEEGVDVLQRDLDLLGFFTASNRVSAQQSAATLANVHDVQHSIEALEQRLDEVSLSLQASREKAYDDQPRSNHFEYHRLREIEEDRRMREIKREVRLVSTSRPSVPGKSTNFNFMTRVKRIEDRVKTHLGQLRNYGLNDPDFEKLCGTLDELRKTCRIDPKDLRIMGRIDAAEEFQNYVRKGEMTFRDGEDVVSRIGHVAVKKVTNCFQEVLVQEIILRQAFLLRHLMHPCILTFYGACWDRATIGTETEPTSTDLQDPNSAFFVTEFMTHNLSAALQQGLLVDPALKVSILRDVTSGIEFLHSRGVPHLELKLSNIFLRVRDGRVTGHAKVGDIRITGTNHFDEVNPEMSQMDPSCNHIPPDGHLEGRDPAPTWDSWSIGVLICVLFDDSEGNLKRLDGNTFASAYDFSFEGKTGKKTYMDLKPERIKNPLLRTLAKDCLSESHKNRPSVTYIRRVVDSVPVPSIQVVHISSRSDTLHAIAKDHLLGKNGKQKDCWEAYRLFKKAVECGSIPALIGLGECFLHGLGVEKDTYEGVRMFTIAAKAGHPSGQYKLGVCLYKGMGVEKNVAAAIICFQRASNRGNAPAKYRLGCHYFNTTQSRYENLTTAVQFWRDAAMLGHKHAQFRLASCFENGVGVQQDIMQASLWYDRSSKRGHYGASVAVQRLAVLVNEIAEGNR